MKHKLSAATHFHKNNLKFFILKYIKDISENRCKQNLIKQAKTEKNLQESFAKI